MGADEFHGFEFHLAMSLEFPCRGILSCQDVYWCPGKIVSLAAPSPKNRRESPWPTGGVGTSSVKGCKNPEVVEHHLVPVSQIQITLGLHRARGTVVDFWAGLGSWL